MMKRICMLLALVLALSCVPAMAAEGDAILGREDENSLYFNYCFSIGDTLYMAGYSSLYTYRVGDPDLTEYFFDLPETEDGEYDIAVLPFSEGGKLYSLNLVTHNGEYSEFEGAKLMALTLRDDNSVGFEALCDVDWSDFVEYYDNNAYAGRPDGIVGAGGKAVVRCYAPQTYGYSVSSIDLATGKREEVSDLRDVYMLTPYRDGTLLVEEYSYENPSVARLLAYDPAGESIQLLNEIAIDDYNVLQGLAYDPDTDTVYCVKAGEICPVDLQTGEVGDGVTDMPLEAYGSASCVLTGGYFAYCSEGVAIRNLNPAQKAQTRLKINDNNWSEAVNSAYYRFANAHGDVSVVLSRDYSEIEHLIESMMNRDDSIDIYVLSAATADFDALYNRGYLMELDGSEKLNALAQSVYPTLRDALSTNGHLVALPMSGYAFSMGVSEKALAALGKTIEDVPDNWPDFLDFLSGLEHAVAEDGRVRLFYPGYSAEDARNDLFSALFEDYQAYVNRTDPAMGYNTELLRGLIEKLEQVDFAALGCPPAEEIDEYGSDDDYDYSPENMLLQVGTGCSIGNFYSDYTPVLLGMAPGQPAPITLQLTVAVVNPFTKNPDMALAFMEELADDMPDTTRYCIDPSLSEPIRGKWNLEALEEWRKQLDELNSELQDADAADRQMIEESIRDTQETLDYIEEYGWDVGPRDIEWYRAHDEGITVATVNWLYNDDTGEAWELMEQYRAGQISVEEMLQGIDGKVQMMLLEGN